MRNAIKALSVLCFITGTMVWAVNKGGTISSSETWSGTITLTSSVEIIGGTVTIQPGTQVSGSRRDIRIQGAGVVRAIGTAANRIKFSSTRFVIDGLTRDSENILQYCDLNRGNGCMLEFRNSSGNELSTLKIDNCKFLNGGYCCMYITSGGSAIISNSEFDNGNIGIFSHGGDVLDVSYTVFKNTSCGIVSGGMGGTKYFWEPMHTIVNHCVFYNIIEGRAPSYISPVDGYGICSINYAGTMDISNCIFHTITNSSIRDWNIEDPNCTWGYWTINADYNCHYQLGGDPIRLKTMGSHSMETNPRMTNPAGGDYSLQSTSSCRNQASDGSHIGKWQEAGIRDKFIKSEKFNNRVKVSANPFARNLSMGLEKREQFSVTIVSGDGIIVKYLRQDTAGQVTWDGRDRQGTLVPNGVYFAIVNTQKAASTTRLVKIE